MPEKSRFDVSMNLLSVPVSAHGEADAGLLRRPGEEAFSGGSAVLVWS